MGYRPCPTPSISIGDYAYRLADPGRSRRSARVLIPAGLRGIAGAGSPGYAMGPGTAIVVDGSAACTPAVAGYDKAGRLIGLTAGHCGNGIQGGLESRRSGVVGMIVVKNKQVDLSVINFNKAAVRPVRTVGGHRHRDRAAPAAGQRVCKVGPHHRLFVRSGDGEQRPQLRDPQLRLRRPGDSGGPVIANGKLVGILTGGAGWRSRSPMRASSSNACTRRSRSTP